MTPVVSIVVVLYNSAGELAECLQSIRADVESEWAELLVVDNASPDDSVAVTRQEMPQARLFLRDENGGFAAGVNTALREVSGQYVLLLNPDVRVPEGGLHALVAWMDRHQQIAAASPELLGADGHSEDPGRAFPSIWRTLLEVSRLHRLLPRRTRARVLGGAYSLRGDQLSVGWVPGTAMIVRATTAAQVGPLSEALFMYGEDIEWCWRIRRTGGTIGVCGEVSFPHATSTSSVRSWGALEKDRRLAAGSYAASRLMYGDLHARLLAAVTAFAFWVEARSPGRSLDQRGASLGAARRWLELAKAR
jgi:GT2 family glycosyltransferase